MLKNVTEAGKRVVKGKNGGVEAETASVIRDENQRAVILTLKVIHPLKGTQIIMMSSCEIAPALIPEIHSGAIKS